MFGYCTNYGKSSAALQFKKSRDQTSESLKVASKIGMRGLCSSISPIFRSFFENISKIQYFHSIPCKKTWNLSTIMWGLTWERARLDWVYHSLTSVLLSLSSWRIWLQLSNFRDIIGSNDGNFSFGNVTFSFGKLYWSF